MYFLLHFFNEGGYSTKQIIKKVNTRNFLITKIGYRLKIYLYHAFNIARCALDIINSKPKFSARSGLY